jgi:hypothetical protein
MSGEKTNDTPQRARTRRKASAKLQYCDLDACQGVCCSDGAFLQPAEERLIHRLVKKYPEHFSQLPEGYIYDGEWEGNTGRKTATYAFQFQNKPDHFANTRCVFSEADGKCSMQTLAVKLGKHKWDYKPMGCWLFPLGAENGKLIAPPLGRRDDPNNLGKHYPGFAAFTPCGKNEPKGRVWWIALKEEVRQFRSAA